MNIISFDTTHTAIETVGITLAVSGAIFARSLFKIKEELSIAILGIVMLFSACADLFNLVLSTIPGQFFVNKNLEILSWTLYQSMVVIIFLAGAYWIFQRNQQSFGKKTAQFVLISASLGLVTFIVSIYILIQSNTNYFNSTYFLAIWNWAIVGFFIGSALVYAKIYQRYPSGFTLFILLAFFPEILSQICVSMMAGMNSESMTLIAHGFKTTAYALLLSGIGKELLVAYQNLETKQKEIQTLSHYKSIFISNMSHEIRTPLHGIKGSIELLQNSHLSAPQTNLIKQLKCSADMLHELLNDILDTAKSEMGKLGFESIPVQLPEICEKVIQVLTSKASEKKLPLYTYISPQITAAYRSDPVRLEQVFLNLLSNAIKFTQKGFVYFSAELIQDTPEESTFKFRIQDTGIGIHEDKLTTLFEPFSQAENSTHRHYGGSGLGLSICKKIVDQMEGMIHLKSTPGKGSQFSVTLTLKKINNGAPQPLPKPRHPEVLILSRDPQQTPILKHYFQALGYQPKIIKTKRIPSPLLDTALETLNPAWIIQDHSTKPGKHLLPHYKNIKILHLLPPWIAPPETKTASLSTPFSLSQLEQALCPTTPHAILIVDDNPINLQIAKEIVKKLGHRPILGKNGTEAFTKLTRSAQSISLILMDFQMPGQDGIEVTQQIRIWEKSQNTHPVPIIALSAANSDEEKERFIQAGMQDSLKKPFNQRQLQTIINQWIQRPRP